METKRELTEKILKLTILIQEKHPELAKYLAEVQETLPILEDHEVTAESLSMYYDTMVNLLADYLIEHPELG
jgi:hypothetical protein